MPSRHRRATASSCRPEPFTPSGPVCWWPRSSNRATRPTGCSIGTALGPTGVADRYGPKRGSMWSISPAARSMPQRPQATDRPQVSRLVECDKFVWDRWEFDSAAAGRRRRPLSHPHGIAGRGADRRRSGGLPAAARRDGPAAGVAGASNAESARANDLVGFVFAVVERRHFIGGTSPLGNRCRSGESPGLPHFPPPLVAEDLARPSHFAAVIRLAARSFVGRTEMPQCG